MVYVIIQHLSTERFILLAESDTDIVHRLRRVIASSNTVLVLILIQCQDSPTVRYDSVRDGTLCGTRPTKTDQSPPNQPTNQSILVSTLRSEREAPTTTHCMVVARCKRFDSESRLASTGQTKPESDHAKERDDPVCCASFQGIASIPIPPFVSSPFLSRNASNATTGATAERK
eukprot:jgi/Psemu1/15727/gm1.15727_g